MAEQNPEQNTEEETSGTFGPIEAVAEEPAAISEAGSAVKPADEFSTITAESSSGAPVQATATAPPKPFLLKPALEAKWSLEFLPDILKNVHANTLDVQFHDKKADNGTTLTPTEVNKKPALLWNVEQGCKYLIMMVDPDAPTKKNPKLSLYQHWLVGNVPGSEIDKGTVLIDYIGAAPPKNSGPHRYVLLVYKQPGEIAFSEKKLTSKVGKGREKFDLPGFVKEHNLGEPIAGNYFIAEWDSYVPTIEKQLGVAPK